jgi:MFS family permease
VGAAGVAIWLAAAPLRQRVGVWMFASVGVFGLATIAFGLSTSFLFSVAALVVVGASDMVSVYVRSSLIQLATPDDMRGRVASTSFVCISASNELGEFQSGVFARWLGPATAVVVGGVGAVICAAAWIRLFPQLWRIDAFEDALAYAEDRRGPRLPQTGADATEAETTSPRHR